MVSEEMRRCREKDYDKWMDLAQYIWKLVELPGTYREDLTVILVFHMKRSIVIDGQEVVKCPLDSLGDPLKKSLAPGNT